MKTKKFIFGAVLMVLACMVFVVGVLAASNVSVNINGMVNFEAIGNVKATITMQHTAENAISIEKTANDTTTDVTSTGSITIEGTEQSVSGNFNIGDENNQINITAQEGENGSVSYSYLVYITNNYQSTDVADKKDLKITFTPPATSGDNTGDDIEVLYQSNYDWTTVETTKKQLVLAPGATVEIIVTFTTSALVSNIANLASSISLESVQDATSQIQNVWSGNIAESFAGGDGSAETPYLISNGEQLALLASTVNSGESTTNKHYKLTNNIYLNYGLFGIEKETMIYPTHNNLTTIPSTVHPWLSIGSVDLMSQNIRSFDGSFDGDGYRISGLYIMEMNMDNYISQGLFGYAGENALIQNVGIVNNYILGTVYIGSVCGFTVGDIANCYHTGITVAGIMQGGGIVGYSNGGDITGCYNTGIVTGDDSIGGVCGETIDANITACYNTGFVSAFSSACGVAGLSGTSIMSKCYNTGIIKSLNGRNGQIAGIATGLGASASLTDCYNTGTVIGGEGDDVGGIAGLNKGKISNSYNTGIVTGFDYVGGVCGYNNAGTITNSYNTGDISGDERVAGVSGFSDGVITNSYNTGTVVALGEYGPGAGVCLRNSGTIENCYWLYDTVAGLGMETGYVNNGGTATNCSSKTLSELQTESFFTTASNWNAEYLWNFENTWRWDNDLKRPVFKSF